VPAVTPLARTRSSALTTHDPQAMRLRAQSEGIVVRGHDQVVHAHLFPEQRGRQMNRISTARDSPE
jgi:hypothetical protein